MDFISQIAWQGILFQFVSNEMKVHHICGKPSPHLWRAYWCSTKGAPITMPVNYYSSENQQLVQSDDEYLFGPNLLVAPIM